MIYRLSISQTKGASVNHNELTVPKVSIVEMNPLRAIQSKAAALQGALIFRMLTRTIEIQLLLPISLIAPPSLVNIPSKPHPHHWNEF